MGQIKQFFDTPYKRTFWITFSAVTLFKLWAMTIFPITCDESYYWLWHQRLALSYVDHPPFIAYWNWLISLFGQYNLINFRLGGLVLALLATYFIYLTGKTVADDKVGYIAATLFQLVPHYIIIWLTVTVDNPLALFWIISLFLVVRIMKEGRGEDWYWLGVGFGLGLLSKYTMVFFLLPLLIILAINKEQRKWFFRWEPYLGLIISLAIFSPVIFWNFKHNFVSLAFHSSRLGRADFLQNLSMLLGDQLVHFTPFLFLGLLIYSRQLWQKSQFLFIFSLPLLALFAGLTFFIKIWAHWVIVYQSAAIVGIALMVAENDKTVRRLLVSLWVFAVLAIALLLFGSAMLLPRQALYRQNYSLPERYAPLPDNTYMIAPYLGLAGQLNFYTHRKTYMAEGVLKLEENGFGLKQFELWGGPPLKPGDNIVYFGKNDLATRLKLKEYFAKVEARPDLDIFVIESYLDDLVPYYCLGLKEVVRL